MQCGAGVAKGIVFLVWLVMMLSMIAGYVVLLIAVWRGMKAHESIALSIQEMVQKQR